MPNTSRKSCFLMTLTLFVALVANVACAGQAKTMNEGSMSSNPRVEKNVVGVQGYDLVSYRNNEKPLRGNGNHVAEHQGVTYLFINKANQQAFQKNPDKYLPAYGGYCAYGVAVGKKFSGDPDVWKIVDDRLYLNLDNKISGIWNKDVPGNIEKADRLWKTIKHKKASEL